MNANRQLSIGTGGGTLLSMSGQLGLHDVAGTACLAALGAVISFFVTLLLQQWQKRRK